MTKHKCTICNYTYDTEKVEHPGTKPLSENWPKIARWIKEHSDI